MYIHPPHKPPVMSSIWDTMDCRQGCSGPQRNMTQLLQQKFMFKFKAAVCSLKVCSKWEVQRARLKTKRKSGPGLVYHGQKASCKSMKA